MSRKKSNKHEKVCQRTINSGGMWFQKGDIRYCDYVIECKITDKKGFNVTLTILEKLWKEALEAQKEPIIEIAIKRKDREYFRIQGLVTLERI
jgi:Holliday junction resolvase